MSKIWPILAGAMIAAVMLVFSLLIERGRAQDVVIFGAVIILIAGEITTVLWLKASTKDAPEDE